MTTEKNRSPFAVGCKIAFRSAGNQVAPAKTLIVSTLGKSGKHPHFVKLGEITKDGCIKFVSNQQPMSMQDVIVRLKKAGIKRYWQVGCVLVEDEEVELVQLRKLKAFGPNPVLCLSGWRD